LRTVRVDAARGPILVYKGRLLVSNRIGTAAQLWTAYMPRRGRERMLRRLSAILIVPVPELRKLLREHKSDPLTPVTLKEDLSQEEIFYLKEHRGTSRPELNDIHLRDYRYGSLAPQILGHVGATGEQLKAAGTATATAVGGRPRVLYDRFLAGRRGWPSCADSMGRPRSSRCGASSRSRLALRTTLDAKLRRCRGRARVRHPGRPREQELVCERRRSRDRPRTGAIRAWRLTPRTTRGSTSEPKPAKLRR
jgi:cell division protein FtsI/penicillin-binding protein 2